jgi:putative copper export protein
MRLLRDVLIVDRTIGYLAVAALCGGWLLLALVWPTVAAVRRTRQVLVAAWIAGFASTVAGLGLQAATVRRTGFGGVGDPDVLADALQTDPGRAWATRAVLFVMALPLLAALVRDTRHAARAIWWRVAALAVGGGLLWTLGLVGDSTETPHSTLGAITDFVVHVAAVAAGIGGLVLLVSAARPPTQQQRGLPRRVLRLTLTALPIGLLVLPGSLRGEAAPGPRSEPARDEQALGGDEPGIDRYALGAAGVSGELDQTGRVSQASDGADAGRSGSPVGGLTSSGIPEVAMLAYRLGEQTAEVSDPGCGLGWPLLAAIGRVESNHGRYGGAQLLADGYGTRPIRGIPLDGRPGVATIRDTDDGAVDGDTTYDRAVGPMQFIPSSWRAVAADGNDDGIEDPDNIFDAALGAATYLCAGHGNLHVRADRAAAVRRYNHSDEYVATVLALADAYERGQTGTLPDPGPATPVPPTLPTAPPGPANGGAPPALPADTGGGPTTTTTSTTRPPSTVPPSTSTTIGVLTAVEDLLGL